MLTGLLDNLLKLEFHADFKKFVWWIMKSRHNNGRLALSTYAEVGNNFLKIKTYSHKPT